MAAPTERQALDALAQGVEGKSRKYVIELRAMAWQAGNDSRRDADPSLPVDWSPEARKNLEELAVLLRESDRDERWRKAEVFRELGRFDEALELLSKPVTGELANIFSRLRKLAEQRYPGVVELRGAFGIFGR